MTNRVSQPRRAVRLARATGAGLVELLLALAISVILLLAVASAVGTASKGVRVLQQQGVQSLRGRLAIGRMTSVLRSSAGAAQPYPADANFAKGTPAQCTGFDVADTENGVAYRYWFDSTTKTLKTRQAADSSGLDSARDSVMVRGVTDFRCSLVPTISQEHWRLGAAYDEVASAWLSLTIDPTVVDPTDPNKTSELTSIEKGKSSQPLTLATTVFPRVANYSQKSMPMSIIETKQALHTALGQ